jgi:hypothetical protein
MSFEAVCGMWVDALSIAAVTRDSMIPRGLSYEQHRNKVHYRCGGSIRLAAARYVSP